ncbi:MAG: SPOR domain-containing protein [Endozoicomonas sp.]
MSSRTTARRGASKAAGRKKPASKSRIPGWLWLLTGFCAGFFLAFLIKLTPSPVEVPPRPGADTGEKVRGSEPNPVFDFYTLLPESEVILPEVEREQKPAATTPNRQQPAKTEPRKPSRYLLQAGSFRSSSDADRLRAQLLLAGLTPKVEKVDVGSGESWHRVQLGPFENRGELDNAQKVLAEMKIDSLLLKLK